MWGVSLHKQIVEKIIRTGDFRLKNRLNCSVKIRVGNSCTLKLSHALTKVMSMKLEKINLVKIKCFLN